MNLPYVNHEAEEYFKNLSKNEEALQTCFHYICETLNYALESQDYAALLSLISYIESGNGHLAFEHIGETRRILRILNIVALEHKYLGYTFASDCFCKDELMNKYYLTLFSFRRLLFQLSDFSTDEAVQFLQNNVLSHFAVFVIASEELMIPTLDFYEIITNIYTPYWTHDNIQQLQQLISQLP